MGLFDHWPYTNFHELNLSWLLKRMEDLSNKVDNFVALNTIKYADPIQWNITTQYETNTVVIDPNTGTAYISVQPVPSGVGINNTDYWSVIFTLNLIAVNENFTLRDDGSSVLSTFSSVAGDWLLWNGTLYKVTQTINTNEAYIVGYNISRYTVEMFIKDYIQTLSDIIGDLADLNTIDKDSVVNAINEVNNKLLDYGSPKQYGAIGDGVTDDSAAFQSVIDNHNIIVVPEGDYLIKDVNILNKKGLIMLFMDGAALVPVKNINTSTTVTYHNMLNIVSSSNLYFYNMKIKSDFDAASNTIDSPYLYGTLQQDGCNLIFVKSSNNININNLDISSLYIAAASDNIPLFYERRTSTEGYSVFTFYDCSDIRFNNPHISETLIEEAIAFFESSKIYIKGGYFTSKYGAAYISVDYCDGGEVSDCFFEITNWTMRNDGISIHANDIVTHDCIFRNCGLEYGNESAVYLQYNANLAQYYQYSIDECHVYGNTHYNSTLTATNRTIANYAEANGVVSVKNINIHDNEFIFNADDFNPRPGINYLYSITASVSPAGTSVYPLALGTVNICNNAFRLEGDAYSIGVTYSAIRLQDGSPLGAIKSGNVIIKDNIINDSNYTWPTRNVNGHGSGREDLILTVITNDLTIIDSNEFKTENSGAEYTRLRINLDVFTNPAVISTLVITNDSYDSLSYDSSQIGSLIEYNNRTYSRNYNGHYFGTIAVSNSTSDTLYDMGLIKEDGSYLVVFQSANGNNGGSACIVRCSGGSLSVTQLDQTVTGTYSLTISASGVPTNGSTVDVNYRAIVFRF